MRSAVALVVAIFVIFGAAMAAEFSGLVERDTASTASASDGHEGAHAEGDAAAGGAGEKAAFSSVSEKQLRLGVMGGFVMVCFYVLLRHRGDI